MSFSKYLLIGFLAFGFWIPSGVAGDKAQRVPEKDGGGELDYIKGRQLFLDGKLEEAAPLLERALESDSGNALLNHQLAELYLRLSRLEKATKFAKAAVEKDPKNAEYRATYGGILASDKKYAEAKEQYLQIQELDPSNTRTPLLLGILEAEAGNTEEAIKTLSKAYKDNPDNFMALFYRAKVYLDADKFDQAKEDLEKCLTLKPSFLEAGAALGLIYERLGETDAAIRVYGRIQANGRFKKRLAQLYLQKNEYQKALDELIEYEKVEPDDYTARVKIALIYFEIKNYAKALSRLEDILKEQPEADNIRFYIGAIHEENRQFDKAVESYKKVSKDSSFFKEAMLHIGYIYREQTKTKEGLVLAKKLLEKNPEIVEFYDMQASFYEAEKNYNKALETVQKGLVKFADDEKLLYFQGALYDKTGQRNKAIESMKQLLKSNASNAHAMNFLAYTYAEMGQNFEEAEKLIRQAIELRPKDGYIQDSLGWILFKRGKVEEAQTFLEKAIVLQPDEPVILEHLGDLHASKRENEKAAEYYRKALQISEKRDKEMARKIEGKLSTLAKNEKS